MVLLCRTGGALPKGLLKSFLGTLSLLILLSLLLKNMAPGRFSTRVLLDLHYRGAPGLSHEEHLDSSATPKRKTILLWTQFYGLSGHWELLFNDMVAGECPISNCLLTHDHNDLNRADAVVFHLIDLQMADLPLRRPAGQIWVLFSLESPAYQLTRQINITRLNGLFNWTMTYRWDSDVPVPYGLVLPRNTRSDAVQMDSLPEAVQRVLPLNPRLERSEHRQPKKRLVAWMASNCDAPSRRTEYVKELRKHIAVDVYGKCGRLRCGQRESVLRQKNDRNVQCEQTMAGYKFYLAFENTLCPDYVTEKFFRTLTLGTVPVVLGGAQYSELAPDGSYIDAMKYEPRQLAQLLLYLHKNDTAYQGLFRWQSSHYIVNSHPLRPLTCGLCRRLHELTPGALVGSHNKLDRWYNAKQCSQWYPKRRS